MGTPHATNQRQPVPGDLSTLRPLSPHAPRNTAITRGVEVVDVEAGLLYDLNRLLHLQQAGRIWDSGCLRDHGPIQSQVVNTAHRPGSGRHSGALAPLTLSVQFRLELSWKLHFPWEQQKACKSFHSLRAETRGLGLHCPNGNANTKPAATAPAALQAPCPAAAQHVARCPVHGTNKCAHGSCLGRRAISTAWLLAQIRPGASLVLHTTDPAGPIPHRAPILLAQGCSGSTPPSLTQSPAGRGNRQSKPGSCH